MGLPAGSGTITPTLRPPPVFRILPIRRNFYNFLKFSIDIILIIYYPMCMKTKTVNITDELWDRIKECMAKTKIFNASEFLRLSLEAAVERVERKYGLNQAQPTNGQGQGQGQGEGQGESRGLAVVVPVGAKEGQGEDFLADPES